MSNLWYKIAEYYGESNHPGQQLDSNLWKPHFNNNVIIKERRETYWKNLSSMGPDDTVAYSAGIGSSPGPRLIHRTCLPGVEKDNFKDENGLEYSNLKPVSFQKLRQEQNSQRGKSWKVFPQCSHCAGTIVPSRPHSEKECFYGKNLTESGLFRIDEGKCSQITQYRPEGWYSHVCQHGLNQNCTHHGGFDPRHAFPQGHITDDQVKAFGTSGDLEVLLGSEAEHRVRNNLPIDLGRNNRS